jgi:hypothetical protein
MKTLARIYSVFFVVFLAFAAFAQSPNGEAFSENKKFSAEISTAQLDKPLLSVFRHEDEVKQHVWTRSLAVKGEEQDDDNFQSRIPFQTDWLRTLVSDDGKTVILRARYLQPDTPALRVLTQAGSDKSYEMDEIRDLLTADWEDWHTPQFLEFFLENEKPPVYAMWFAPSAEWVVLDLEQLALRKANAVAATALDALALPRAREIARQYRPTGLKKLLQPVMQKAAEFMPGVISPNQPQSFYERGEAAYRYLAHKKNPADRKLIEELLEAELQKTVNYAPGFGGAPMIHVGLTSRERALADELLAEWDGKRAAETQEDVPATAFVPNSNGKTLSGISGQVNLPFGAPTNAASIWIYLIPARVSPGKWAGDSSVRKVWHDPQEHRRMMGPIMRGEQEPFDQISFFFNTLEPGEYRVKAVWDRRPPNTTPGDKAICVPEAGDYESAESETLKLAAGQNASGVILNCTNRVGQAAEYFAADDLWQKQYPPTKETRRVRRPTSPKALTRAPVREWVLKTNENNASVTLKGIQLVEFSSGDEISSRQLRVTFRMPRVTRHEMINIKGKLVDDHGCAFEGYGHSSNGSSYEMNFSVVPYGSKEMVLSFSREDDQDENGRPFRNGPRETKLASFTLTNLCRVQPADWKPDAEPPRRDLDIVSVELTSFDPRVPEFVRPPGMMAPGGRPYQPSQNKFTFTANGKAAPGWRKIQGRFKDRWGNASQNIGAFCEEEEIIQYAVSFMRDPVKGVFSADEKIEIPVKQIPGAGESVPIAIRKQLQGLEFEVVSVGGTGEFTYRNGESISAVPEINEEDAPVAAGPGFGPQFAPHFQGRAVQPKMYLKLTHPMQPGFDWMRRQTGKGQLTIAAKIPHAVCRVSEPESDTKFALLEQDTSVPDPLDPPGLRMHYGGPPPPHSPVQFLPLDYRAGDADRKLTFIVQKTRTAEFYVRVPKGSIPRSRSE